MMVPIAGESEVDSMKSIFMDVDPTFLLITMFISVVHLLFDILAFKVVDNHECVVLCFFRLIRCICDPYRAT